MGGTDYLRVFKRHKIIHDLLWNAIKSNLVTDRLSGGIMTWYNGGFFYAFRSQNDKELNNQCSLLRHNWIPEPSELNSSIFTDVSLDGISIAAKSFVDLH